MVELDTALQIILKDIYEKMGDATELSVSAPEYQQTQVDELVLQGLIKKIDTSTLSGWSYILQPTHEGQTYFINLRKKTKADRKAAIIEWIKWLVPTAISIIALIVSLLK